MIQKIIRLRLGEQKISCSQVILRPVRNCPWSSHEFFILVKTGQMNNTQLERTTHHDVMYRVIYFEAYDNVINGITERFHQADFEIYKHIQNIFINAINQKCYEYSLSILKEMYKINFHWENLTVQLGHLSKISVTKFFESFVNFGKNQSQKVLLPEVTKLAKLLLVLLATNAASERSFSAMKRIKTYLRSTRAEID